MITKQISNTYIVSGTLNVFAIEITYSWWIFKWRMVKASKIDKKCITHIDIEIESCKLFAE